MEENKEKKYIKISLGTFTVLIVSMLILGVATVLGFQKANEINNTPQLTKNEQKQQNTEIITNNNQKSEQTIQQNNNKNTNAENKILDNNLSDFDLSFLKLENKKENKIYSPLSIKYALKMLEEGAAGNSRDQISSVIGNYNLTKYSSNSNMALANSLFVKDSYRNKIKQDYINALKSKYNAEVNFDSFESARSINNWINSKTLGIIPEIAQDSDVQALDFALINALAIDMEWKNKFYDEDNYKKGFDDAVEYIHEDYYAGHIAEGVSNKEFDNNKLEVAGMEIFASMDNYDIVKILGEENIRKTVGDAYREWIKEHGTSNYWEYPDEGYENGAKPLTTSDEIEKEISRYLDKYIKDIKSNYTEHREVKSIDFSLYTDDDVKVFAKDLKEYNGTTLQYIGIMPVKQNLDEYIKSVDNKVINNIVSNLKELKRENFKDGVITCINGFIPKFNFEYNLNLMEDLKRNNITDVFDKEKANLQNLADGNAYIGAALHKANIEFTQDGIKAAAATMMGGYGGGGDGFDYIYEVPIEHIDLTFDKPYMFLIRDKATGETWFIGTVYEPLLWTDEPSYMEYYNY